MQDHENGSHADPRHEDIQGHGRRRVGGVLFVAGAAAAGALALGVPLGTIFVFGLLLLCPLMMIGMHGGHADHSARSVDQPDSSPVRSREDERT